MASPREVAEKAFALLHDALRDSEERATALDEELKRKKPSKNQLEQKLEVVTHRLETAEEECERYKRDAGHLEEVVANERAKIAKLKKKLEIAESGPDKLTKKEINFWRAKAEEIDTETKDYKSRLTNLRKELKSREKEIEDLKGKPKKAPGDSGEVADLGNGREQLEERDARVAELVRELEQRDEKVAQLDQELELARKGAQQTRDTRREHEAEVKVLEREIKRLEESLAEAHSATKTLNKQLEAGKGKFDQLRDHDKQLEKELAQAHARAEAAEAEKKELGRSAEALKKTLQIKEQELKKLSTRHSQRDKELKDLTSIQSAKDKELETLLSRESQKGKELETLRGAQAQYQAELKDAREQIAGLEAELKEEKETNENLSEVANERTDQLNKLEEKLEEAEERLEEANWRLEKAGHFERLVRRRKSLIGSLIEGLRAKTKSNAALKAGLDSLRTHKATAEAQHRRVLGQMEQLRAKLREAEEAVERRHGATLTQEQLTTGDSNVAELEERINTQVELIQTLEEELKTVKASRSMGDNDHEVEDLRAELETKNQVISGLQSDVDELQRKLAKLRGSESETVRLKADTEKDKVLIDALEREVSHLRDALNRHVGGEGSEADALAREVELEAKLKEREDSVTRLLGAVKEHEAKIAQLTEAVDSWKRKYEFVSTEAPDAYKAAGE